MRFDLESDLQFVQSPSPRQAQPLREELGQADSQPVAANVEQNQNDF